MTVDLRAVLENATIAPEVAELRPDYRVLLIAVDGIEPGASDESSETALVEAEEKARTLLAETAVAELPHIADWREAYRAFGAKPQRTRNSLEALTRRAEGGLPRVNRLTDYYNAISVKYQIPLGGEDLEKYVGAPQLVRASGEEDFVTFSSGEPKVEHPKPGEVVWRDDEGITCRIWNWRQCARTGLTDETRAAVFILDALGALTDEELEAAGAELVSHLKKLGAEVRVETRLLTA